MTAFSHSIHGSTTVRSPKGRTWAATIVATPVVGSADQKSCGCQLSITVTSHVCEPSPLGAVGLATGVSDVAGVRQSGI